MGHPGTRWRLKFLLHVSGVLTVPAPRTTIPGTSIGFWLRISSNDDMVVWQRTLAILVKKGDGRHASMNRGFGTAGAPPQIRVVRAMRAR